MEKKTIIQILGNGRSASTMLDLKFGSDEATISCGEVWAYFRPWIKGY